MLVVHPHCVSGGGGGSGTLALASPAYHSGADHPTPHSLRPSIFSAILPVAGDEPTIRITSATTMDSFPSTSLPGVARTSTSFSSSRSKHLGRSVMFGHYDRTSFLSPRQERARQPTGPDFRGLYHKRRVGLVSPPLASTTVRLQLDKFPIWGQLRKSNTDLRSSLPSKREIETAKEQLVFFAHRRGYTRQEGSTSYLCSSITQEPTTSTISPATTTRAMAAEYDKEGDSDSESDARIVPAYGDPYDQTPKPQEKKIHVAVRGSVPPPRASSSAKSTKSAPAELPKLMVVETEPVATRSEKICQLKAKYMPEMTFAADGQLESGLYPATFKQTLGIIGNARRHDVFVKFGGGEWRPEAKPVNYGNLFLPRVTCQPKTIGVRYRTELDLVKAGKVSQS